MGEEEVGVQKAQVPVDMVIDTADILIVDIIIAHLDNIDLVEVFLTEMVVGMKNCHKYYHIHSHIHYHLHGFVIQEYLREHHILVVVVVLVVVDMYVYLLVVQQLVH